MFSWCVSGTDAASRVCESRGFIISLERLWGYMESCLCKEKREIYDRDREGREQERRIW